MHELDLFWIDKNPIALVASSALLIVNVVVVNHCTASMNWSGNEMLQYVQSLFAFQYL